MGIQYEKILAPKLFAKEKFLTPKVNDNKVEIFTSSCRSVKTPYFPPNPLEWSENKNSNKNGKVIVTRITCDCTSQCKSENFGRSF